MSRRASVQTAHLRLEAIEDDVVQLGHNQYRAVLEVGSVSFALQGVGEQEALLASFAAFLNSLTFPVQIVVRVLPIDFERHLRELEHLAICELSEALASLARDHVAFLRRLARSRTLLERRFYLVVPADTRATVGRRSWPFARREADADVAAARRQLTFRCEEAARQLSRCGLAARRLESAELARLYYACWCPELSRIQRLRQEIAEYTALTVGKNPSPDVPSSNASGKPRPAADSDSGTLFARSRRQTGSQARRA